MMIQFMYVWNSMIYHQNKITYKKENLIQHERL